MNSPAPSKASTSVVLHTQSTQVPLSLLKSGQFLALAPDCKGGLILQKRFYADFVGPGAAVGGHFDVDCMAVYGIGSVMFYSPTSWQERQPTFQTRMVYSQTLQKILLTPAPLRRAVRMMNFLSRWQAQTEEQMIPDLWIAQLAGVLPSTVAIARQYQATRNNPLSVDRPLSTTASQGV